MELAHIQRAKIMGEKGRLTLLNLSTQKGMTALGKEIGILVLLNHTLGRFLKGSLDI